MNTPPTAMVHDFEITTERIGKRVAEPRIARSSQHPRSGPRPAAGLPPTALRILVFDDDRGIRSTLRRILERPGYQVFTFPTPSPCLYCRSRVGEKCADVLLSDLSMPEMRGIDFLENQRRVGCKIDCIGLMSGSFNERDQRRARDIGCKIIPKPFDIHQLYSWIDEGTRRRSRVLVDHIFQGASNKYIDPPQIT